MLAEAIANVCSKGDPKLCFDCFKAQDIRGNLKIRGGNLKIGGVFL